ncbi:MAG TPA: hypothetical protein DCX14_13935 [Flavobacteriales bacterium]|nr:hypothetical protein [Flavobacteriales bacterium]
MEGNLDNILIGAEDMRDNQQRAKYAVQIFWVIVVVNVVAVASGYLQLDLLELIRDNGDYTDAQLDANDTRQTVVGLIQTLVYVSSMVLFVQWFRRAYANLERAGINIEHQESMALWGFAIPIISLFRPFTIAREIANGYVAAIRRSEPDYINPISKPLMGVWWTLYLITNVFGQIAFRSIFKDETVEQMITSSQAYILSDFLDIPAALITLNMILQISKTEQHYANIRLNQAVKLDQ